jgi:aminopeptidase-like protein
MGSGISNIRVQIVVIPCTLGSVTFLTCHVGIEVCFEDLKEDTTLSAMGDAAGEEGAKREQSE